MDRLSNCSSCLFDCLFVGEEVFVSFFGGAGGEGRGEGGRLF